jgi:Arc-like DNA binding domain
MYGGLSMVPLVEPQSLCYVVPSNFDRGCAVAAQRKARKAFWARDHVAQIKVRLPEVLRRHLEREAARNGRSMNAEIIKRLSESFRVLDQTKLIAKAVLDGLDDAIVYEMVDMFMREQAAEDLADSQREEAQIEAHIEKEDKS